MDITTVQCIPFHYTALHYTTLHNTTQQYTDKHYTTIHYTILHYTTLHCTTPHYTTPHYTFRCQRDPSQRPPMAPSQKLMRQCSDVVSSVCREASWEEWPPAGAETCCRAGVTFCVEVSNLQHTMLTADVGHLGSPDRGIAGSRDCSIRAARAATLRPRCCRRCLLVGSSVGVRASVW